MLPYPVPLAALQGGRPVASMFSMEFANSPKRMFFLYRWEGLGWSVHEESSEGALVGPVEWVETPDMCGMTPDTVVGWLVKLADEEWAQSFGDAAPAVLWLRQVASERSGPTGGIDPKGSVLAVRDELELARVLMADGRIPAPEAPEVGRPPRWVKFVSRALAFAQSRGSEPREVSEALAEITGNASLGLPRSTVGSASFVLAELAPNLQEGVPDAVQTLLRAKECPPALRALAPEHLRELATECAANTAVNPEGLRCPWDVLLTLWCPREAVLDVETALDQRRHTKTPARWPHTPSKPGWLF